MKESKEKPSAIVINFSLARMWGKVGPLKDEKEVHEWCVSFRRIAVEQKADMTALPLENVADIFHGVCCHDYLPSKDACAIITNARATALIGPR